MLKAQGRGLLIVGLLLLGAGPGYAEPINLSFESQDLSGWEASGNVSVIGDAVLLPPWAPEYAPQPTHGDWQALLGSDGMSASYMESWFGIGAGSLTTPDSVNGQVYTRGSGLKREFTLMAGDTITFDWTFVSGETVTNPAFPNNDAAYFISNVGTQTLLSTAFLAGGTVAATAKGEFTATHTGTYSLGVGVFDQSDTFEFAVSYLAVDNFVIHQATGETGPPTSVPEPGTLLMLTSGFAAVLTARRYRIN